MKRPNWILVLSLLLFLHIYTSPASDSLELAATLCHFSDTGLKCSCPEEANENRNEQRKAAKKVRKENA